MHLEFGLDPNSAEVWLLPRQDEVGRDTALRLEKLGLSIIDVDGDFYVVSRGPGWTREVVDTRVSHYYDMDDFRWLTAHEPPDGPPYLVFQE